VESLRLPTISLPFPSRINAHVEVVHEHTLAWSTQFGLVQKESARRRYLASRFAWLTARAYPAVGGEELRLLDGWLTWLFLFDDQFDECLVGKEAERVQAILDDHRAILADPTVAPCHQRPAAAALADLCSRTFARASDLWRQRFTGHFARYFATYTWSVVNTALGRVPALDDYIERRRHSGGMTMAIDLIELAEHIALPAALLASPEFQTLARATNDVVCWSNDLFSLEKELARGDVNNLVVVLRSDGGLTLQQALDRAGEMLNEAVGEFEQTERALPVFGPKLARAVRVYLCDLKAWMRGNLDWSLSTGRYTQVERTAPGGVASYMEPIV
jgi:hypothetical protein